MMDKSNRTGVSTHGIFNQYTPSLLSCYKLYKLEKLERKKFLAISFPSSYLRIKPSNWTLEVFPAIPGEQHFSLFLRLTICFCTPFFSFRSATFHTYMHYSFHDRRMEEQSKAVRESQRMPTEHPTECWLKWCTILSQYQRLIHNAVVNNMK